jgi:hypothetical protein
MPAGNPDFANGISFWNELWIYEPKSAYYRRHLMLHEGTHGFMSTLLGSCGPGWYMEGIAELLGTHRWDPATGKLTLGIMPESRDEVPGLARITLIQKSVADKGVPPLETVMKIDNQRQLKNEAYAWCWAAARFLDTHPRYRKRFAQLKSIVRDPQFDRRLHASFSNVWFDLNNEWEIFASTLDWGHDINRTAIDFKPSKPLRSNEIRVTIRADRGWQSTGVWLEAGEKYRIKTSGRYQIKADRETWMCEPGGITVEYHAGRPLGIMLGAISARPDTMPTPMPRIQLLGVMHARVNGFLKPFAVGNELELVPERGGTFYLCVNDSPGQLHDNAGIITATISRVGDAP